MGIFHNRKHEEVGEVAVWKLEEPLDVLLREWKLLDPAGLLPDFKSEQRIRQWLAVRLLISTIVDEPFKVDYHSNGRPFIRKQDGREMNCSISHCKEFVAVAISDNKQCGLDVEHPVERVKNIGQRFLSESELEWSAYDTVKLTLLWSAKEALFKLHGQGGIVFREHLKIEPIEFSEEGRFEGRILKPGYETTVEMLFVKRPEMVLVYCFNP